MAEFGKDIMVKEFRMLDAQSTFLNQGSYGTAPSKIIDLKIRYASIMRLSMLVYNSYSLCYCQLGL